MNTNAFKKFLDAILEIENKWKVHVKNRVLRQAAEKRIRRRLRNRVLVAVGGFGLVLKP